MSRPVLSAMNSAKVLLEKAQNVAVCHLEEPFELPLFDDGQAGHSSLPAHFAFPAAGIRTTFSPLFFSGIAGAEDSFVAMRRAS